MKGVEIHTIEGIDRVGAAQWDACAGDTSPFCHHAFLAALERSASASRRTGWGPLHLVAQDDNGAVVACSPLYVKNHSFGEYVFDWSWSEAWQRTGRAYYPKLQCAIPFAPVTGPRLMVRPDWRGRGLEQALAGSMVRIVDEAALSSAHITFLTADEAQFLAGEGWLIRLGMQFHWANAGYRDFDDFLSALSSRKRKTIRKERERALGQGVTIHTLTGAAITGEHWDAFHRFYLDTIEKKWAHAYLTRDFFSRLGATMADNVVLIMAEKDGRWVAGALNLRSADALYGRNWGAEGDFRFLHFEMCYYRAIDYAIAHGLSRVEAGAQGEHKISRGYLPAPTYSAHWIREKEMRFAIADFLHRETPRVEAEMAELAEQGPFKDVEGRVETLQ